jgi:hypothetical protein
VDATIARLAKCLMIAALAVMIGAHWALLQSVAWTTMLADNLRRGSVGEAVSRTFDGQHPCPICKAIANGKKSEKKNDYAPHLKTLEFPLPAENVVLTVSAHFAPPSRADLFARTLSQAPPTPPPRRALA